MLDNTNTPTRPEMIYLIIYLIAIFCLMVVLPITVGIVHYYNGPCASYTGPYPAVAKGDQCVYVPIGK